MSEVYKLRCFWGTGAARWAEEQEAEDLDNNEVWYEGDNGEETTETFSTEAEVRAFIKGVELSNGWNEYMIHEMR